MEATTAAVEAPATTKSTAMEAASAHAASVSTATASVTAATTTTSECRSWLSQADRSQCEQGYSRFPIMLPPLDEVAPKDRTLSQRELFGGQRTLAVN